MNNNIIWRNISTNEYNNIYEISNYGEIRRIKDKKYMSIQIGNTGYKTTRLTANGVRTTVQIHTLFAETFLEKPNPKDGYNIIVKFMDSNKNNITVENLSFKFQKKSNINNINIINNNIDINYNEEITINNFVGKKIINYPNYLISKQGEIFSITKNSLKDIEIEPNGYCRIRLFNRTNIKGKKFYIHRLVALTYIPNPNNYEQVNHKDLNKHNNCLENLEWCTPSMNMQHRANNN